MPDWLTFLRTLRTVLCALRNAACCHACACSCARLEASTRRQALAVPLIKGPAGAAADASTAAPFSECRRANRAALSSASRSMASPSPVLPSASTPASPPTPMSSPTTRKSSKSSSRLSSTSGARCGALSAFLCRRRALEHGSFGGAEVSLGAARGGERTGARRFLSTPSMPTLSMASVTRAAVPYSGSTSCFMQYMMSSSPSALHQWRISPLTSSASFNARGRQSS
mmetsp:Transcript_7352/g.22256  ORF Transcript_7352/g.22256 Transcript_7352/m.22256 type:complete len:227 (+) Transcript_7352:1031-1711(+)